MPRTAHSRAFLCFVLPFIAVALSRCGDALPRPEGPGWDVLVVTVDGFRPDLLAETATPTLDAWRAASGTRRDVITSSPETVAAHATLWTARSPELHGLRADTGFLLDPNHRTLAEQFQDWGAKTAAFVSDVALHPNTGVTRGFETVDLPTRATLEHALVGPGAGPWRDERATEETAQRAARWLERGGDGHEVLLTWVHLKTTARAPRIAPDGPGTNEPRAARTRYGQSLRELDRALAHLDNALERSHRRRRTITLLVGMGGVLLGGAEGWDRSQLSSEAVLGCAWTRHPDGPGRESPDPVLEPKLPRSFPVALASVQHQLKLFGGRHPPAPCTCESVGDFLRSGGPILRGRWRDGEWVTWAEQPLEAADGALGRAARLGTSTGEDVDGFVRLPRDAAEVPWPDPPSDPWAYWHAQAPTDDPTRRIEGSAAAWLGWLRTAPGPQEALLAAAGALQATEGMPEGHPTVTRTREEVAARLRGLAEELPHHPLALGLAAHPSYHFGESANWPTRSERLDWAEHAQRLAPWWPPALRMVLANSGSEHERAASAMRVAFEHVLFRDDEGRRALRERLEPHLQDWARALR